MSPQILWFWFVTRNSDPNEVNSKPSEVHRVVLWGAAGVDDQCGQEGGDGMARDTVRTLLWIAWSLCLARGQEAVEKLCGHPPVPAGATYLNVTGGLGQRDWVVRYVCDNGKSKYQTPHSGEGCTGPVCSHEHELHTPNKTTTTSGLITSLDSSDKA